MTADEPRPIQPTPTYIPMVSGMTPQAPGPLPPAFQPEPPLALEPWKYHQLLRAGRGRSYIWGPFVVIPLILVSVFLGVLAVSLLTALVGMAFFGMTSREAWGEIDALSSGGVGAMGLFVGLASLAVLIPVVWLLVWGVHGLKPRWLTSVRPRMRWSLLFICMAAAFASLIVRFVVTANLPIATDELSGSTPELVAWSDEVRNLLLVALLVTPFQAAAEEYVFRGYLTQVFGSWFTGKLSAVLAVVGPAFLFALAHGSGQSFPVFFDRFAFGLTAGVMVLITGGLEAGIAGHVLNNWLAMAAAIAVGALDGALSPTEASPWIIVSTIAGQGSYLLMVWGIVRLMRVRPTADPHVLAASRGLV